MNITCNRGVYIYIVIIFVITIKHIMACCTVSKWLVLCMLCSSAVWKYKQYKHFLWTCVPALSFISECIISFMVSVWVFFRVLGEGEGSCALREWTYMYSTVNSERQTVGEQNHMEAFSRCMCLFPPLDSEGCQILKAVHTHIVESIFYKNNNFCCVRMHDN